MFLLYKLLTLECCLLKKLKLNVDITSQLQYKRQENMIKKENYNIYYI